MADDDLLLFWFSRLEEKSHPHMLGARAAQSELVGEVAAQRAGDEEQSFAVLNRFAELPVGAGEEGRAPRLELIRLETARKHHRMPPIATELALQLSRTDRRHRA